MIIRYPTASYKTILPQKPSDGGNVTFTISNNVPPRTNLLFPKIPFGLLNNIIQRPIIDERSTLGALIYSISKSNKTLEGNNSRQYEVGQILDFDVQTSQSVTPMLVGETTEIRHNTNALNYDLMGLSIDDQNLIESQSSVIYQVITTQLNEIKKKRFNSEQLINNYQKNLNELSRTIKALEILINNSTDQNLNALLIKLKTQQTTITVKRDAEIIIANDYAIQATQLLDDLTNIGVVVK